MSQPRPMHVQAVLEGEANYHIWAERTKILMVERNCLEAIKTKKPIGDAETLAKWKIINDAAVVCIKCTITNEELANVVGLEDAGVLWQYFQNKYCRKDTLTELQLMREIYSATKGGKSIQQYLSFIKMKVNQLNFIVENNDDKVSSKTTMVVCMGGLPEEYSAFITAISMTPVTFEVFEQRLLSEELRLEQNNIKILAVQRQQHQQRKKPKKYNLCKNHPYSRSHTTAECYLEQRPQVSALSTLIDSGATNSCFTNKAVFSSYSHGKRTLFLADGSPSLTAEGMGDVLLPGGEIKVKGALHCPEFPSNILSVADLVDDGCSVKFDQASCSVKRNGELILCVPRQGRLYVSPAINTSILHQRLGHLSQQNLRLIEKNDLYRGTLAPKHEIDCHTCAEANGKRKSFKLRASTRAESPLEMIHTDLWGPINVSSHGFRYFASFVDDATRYSTVTFLNNKSELAEAFANFKAIAENLHSTTIKSVVCDNGGEYSSNNLKQFCAKAGIEIKYTPPYSPQLNGVSECFNRVLLVKARALMLQANLGAEFWPYAIRTANYLRNISPTTKLTTTPYQAWYGRKPSVAHLVLWGCRAFVLKEGPHRGNKIAPRSSPMVMVGYHQEDQGYILFDPEANRTWVRRNVSFDENCFPTCSSTDEELNWDLYLTEPNTRTVESAESLQTVEPEESEEIPSVVEPVESPSAAEESEEVLMEISEITSESTITTADDRQIDEQSSQDALVLRKPSKGRVIQEIAQGIRTLPKRQSITPKRFQVYELIAEATTNGTPKTFKQAMQSSEGPLWKEAMESELSSQQENGTWTLTPLPANKNCVSSKWVFTHKRDVHGKIIRHKARLVAVGTTQRYGVDYDDTFAPVVRWETIRLLLSIGLQNSWPVDQLDVTTAFLYGEIDYDIYMRQPPGFIDPKHPNYVCKLKKSIYGLKQSPRIWNETLTKAVVAFGLIQSELDPCIFYSSERDLFFIEFVDDILITGTEPKRQALKEELGKRFKIKDEGPVNHFLNVSIIRDGNQFSLNQKAYVEKLLERFGMERAHTCPLPMKPHEFDVNPTPLPSDTPYRQLIGALLYLAQTTRPDIAYVTGVLARQTSSPTTFYWNLAKRVLRYLKGSKDYAITLSKSQVNNIQAYVDSDYGGSKPKRKSTTGFVVFCGSNLISWKSSLQKIIADSTMYAEYIALSSVVREITFLRNLLCEIGYPPIQPSIIQVDNQACRQLAESPGVFHPRSKHIDIRYHMTRQKIRHGHIKVEYVQSKDNLADVLTKALPLPAFQNLTELIRVFR